MDPSLDPADRLRRLAIPDAPMNMSDPLDLDLVRAYVEGRMAAPQRDAFDARLAAEPDLAELVAAFTVVSDVEGEPVPPMQTRFEDLRLDDVEAEAPLRLGRPRLLRTLAAVAAVVLLAVGAFLALRKEGPTGPPPPVVLAAIPADATAPVPAPIPAAVADYAPTGEQGLRFLDGVGYGSARDFATLLGRPLLVFAQVPSCPMCRELERDQFHRSALATAAEPFVLVRENMMKPSPELEARLKDEGDLGWPFFVVDGADGKPASVFSLDPTKPLPDAATLATLFTAAYTSLSPAGRGLPMPWASTRAVVADLRAADAATTERERSAALDRAAAVAPEASPLEGAVRARRAAQAARARAALDAALATATKEGVEAGRALLVAAVAQFEGTPYHADLVRVRDHLTRFGAFPVLEIRK